MKLSRYIAALCIALALAVAVATGASAAPKKGKGKSKGTDASTPQPSGPSGPTTNVVAGASGPEGAPATVATGGKVAILELGALGVSSDMMRNLEMLLRSSLGTIEAVQVISSLDVQLVLQDPKNASLANCGGGSQCAAQVGKVVGADTVIFGTIGALGQSFSLNLRAIDVLTGKEKARQQTSISGNRDMLIPEMRLAAFRLIAPERIVGSLLIEVDISGVEIEIDGRVVGVTPLAKPIEQLAPGDHVVVVRRPGYSQFQQVFTVKPFETGKLKLTLATGQPTAN